MANNLDLEKAYDMLNQDFVMYVLLKFDFSIRWMGESDYGTITSTSFSIIIYGCTHGFSFFFLFKKDIRQGDPLSLYIFILCVKPLIRHLKDLTHIPNHMLVY